jgi:uncharacterized membrane protein
VQEENKRPTEASASPVFVHENWEWGRRDTWWLLAATLAALGVRLFRLDYRGMWTDEFHTLHAILLPWRELIFERMRAGHLPTYFILMKLWSQWAGTSDWALRLPSAIAGAFIVPAVAWFARPYLDRRKFYTLLAIATLNGTAVWASQEARMYGMLLVVATFAHAAYLRTVIHPSWRAWVKYFGVLIVGVALQPVMLLAALSHGFFSWVIRRRHPQHARMALRIWASVIAVVLVPAVAFALFQRTRTLDWDIHSVSDFLRTTLRNVGILWKRLGLVAFGCSADDGLWRALTAIGLTVCFVGVWLGWRRVRQVAPDFLDSPLSDFIRFCVVTVVVPPVVLFVASYAVAHLIGIERYHIPLAAPLWVLCVMGAYAFHGTRRQVLALVLALLVVSGLVRHWLDRGLGGREVVQFVNANANADDVVVCRATPTLIRMIEHYSKRPLRLCAIPERLSDEQLRARLAECCEGAARMWVIEYRDKGKRLKQVVLSQPERFVPLREETIGEARAVLVKINPTAK